MNHLLTNSKKIRLVYNGEVINWKYLEQVQEHVLNSNDIYKNNYTIKNLKLEGHLALDCLVDNNDKIFALCGIFNGGRYPPGVYRVLNRLWAREDMRTGSWSPFLTKSFLPDHLKEFNDILKVIFVSIQGEKGKKILSNFWLKTQAPQWGTGWKMYPKIVKVAPCEQKSCYQYVVYNSKIPGDNCWPVTGITLEDYDKLPN